MNRKNDKFWNIFNKISGRKEELKEKFNYDKCQMCNQLNTIKYNGEQYVCTNINCGIVVRDKLELNQEWRYYGSADTKNSNPNRVGNATNKLLPESSLGSVIARNYKLDFMKLQKYHKSNIMPYRERSLNKIFYKIKSKCESAGIPNIIINQAKKMYTRLNDTKISRGSNRKGLEGTCVYMACKLNGVPRSAKEIAAVFDLNISEMTRGIKKFKEIMKEFNNKNDSDVKFNLTASNPNDYIDRFCSNLRISEENKKICKYINNKAIQLNIVSDNTPASIAAGSIFMISMIKNLNITKTNIAEACKISEVTISKCFKKLYDYRSHIIPENIFLIK